MTDTTGPDLQRPPERPLFLTILCVLTFLLCASSAWLYAGYAFGDRGLRMLEDGRADAVQEMERMGPEAANDAMFRAMMDGQLEILEAMAAHARPMGTFSLAYVVILSVANWLMWKLKKIGFWLFTGAQIPGFLIPFLWIKPSLVALLMFGSSAVLWAGLILLFALNLKHMR